MQERRLPLLKTPHNANDFVFVEDVAKGFVQAIEQNFKVEYFTWGAVIRHQFGEVVAAEELIWGTTVLTEELMESTQNRRKQRFFGPIRERSQQFLGWSPLTSLETGIQKNLGGMQSSMSTPTQAVVLCGGRGTRLKPLRIPSKTDDPMQWQTILEYWSS